MIVDSKRGLGFSTGHALRSNGGTNKVMVTKIITGIVFLVLSPVQGYSQSHGEELRVISSSRDEVTKRFGPGRSEEANRVFYDLPDKEVRVTYYDGGCSTEEENRIGIRKGSILEIKTTPKDGPPMQESSVTTDTYRGFDLAVDRYWYFNGKEGSMVLARKKNRAIDSIYYFVPASKYQNCLKDYFVNDAGLAIADRIGIKRLETGGYSFPTIQMGSYFEADSNASKSKILISFANKILENADASGYVILASPMDYEAPGFQRWQRKFVDQMGRLGVPCNRLLTLSGVGPRRLVTLVVIHKSSIPSDKIVSVCQ